MQHLPSTLRLCGRILLAAVPRRPVLLVPAGVMLVADAGLRLAGMAADRAFVLGYAIGVSVLIAGRMGGTARKARPGALWFVLAVHLLVLGLLVWFGTPAACLHLITAYLLIVALLWALDLGPGPRDTLARIMPDLADGPLAPRVPRVMLLCFLALALGVQAALATLPQPLWLLVAGLMPVIAATVQGTALVSLRLVVEGR